MDWRILGSTFILILLAELGDKTQLAALASSAGSRSTWSVFLGACAALVLSTLLAVALGAALGAYLPRQVVQAVAGVMFLVFGLLWLTSAIRGKPVLALGPPEAPQVLTKWALQAAARFEAASSVNYLDLAAAAKDQRLRTLLSELAVEDREHLARVRQLRAEHGRALLATPRPDPVRPMPATHPELADADQELLRAAIEHEQAAADFYFALADAAPLAGLQRSFHALGEEDQAHADRLRAWIA